MAITLGFWIIGEIPKWYTIERDWLQWTVTILSIPIIGLWFSWTTRNRLRKNQKKNYGYSVLILFVTWILILYLKATVIGLTNTIESGREKILESIAGYTIYQLWIYGGLGLIHGLLGGIILNLDLKKNLEKIKKRHTTSVKRK